MNVEHFGFLSWVFRKGESHEQDGETLARAYPARIEPASGDPAMAFGSSIRLARAVWPGTFGGLWLSMIFSENRYPLFGIMLLPPRNSGHNARPHRARSYPRAKKLNGECPASR
jgi:hypothetical protein